MAASIDHVLDLPALYTRPSSSLLLRTLESLALKPATFDHDGRRPFQHPQSAEAGLPGYLTGIISSPLAWIRDEDVREKIWKTASTRLSERAGSNAMPSSFRDFKILTSDDTVTISVYEPSLIGDNLGHKTWAASYLLAKRLVSLRTLLPAVSQPPGLEPPRVLELGAGTGLVGLAAVAVFGGSIDLTDLPTIVPNLKRNLEYNIGRISHVERAASAFALDWSNLPPAQSIQEEAKYHIILAADPLYSPEHPNWLVNAITTYLRHDDRARVVVELPLRDAYLPEVEAFRSIMNNQGLLLMEEGEEEGFDDWHDGQEVVRCWWGIWGWHANRSEAKREPF